MPSLVYLSEDSERMVFPLGKATLMVGRGGESQVQLPDSSISVNHASIIYESGQFILQDNGSMNGSFINGVRVTRQPLKHRDMIRFGQYLFMVDLEDLPSPTGASPTPVTHVETAAEQIRIMRNETNTRTNVEFRPKGKVAVASAPKARAAQPATVASRPHLKIMLTTPVTANSQQNRYALLAFVCGLLAPVGFLPAIIFGHLANKATGELAAKRAIGMALGYIFVVLWLGAAIYFVQRPKSKPAPTAAQLAQPTRVEVPPVADPLALLRGELMWCPPRQVVQNALASGPVGQGEGGTLTAKGGDLNAALDSVRSVWIKGLIVYELDFIRMGFGTDLQSVRYVIEDCKTSPTFWDFNSTVVPAKKNVLGFFVVPSLDRWTFFERNKTTLSVQISKYNTDNVPWSCAMRGIQLALNEIPPDIQKKAGLLKCGIILKPAPTTCRFVINTREGDALKDWDRAYTYNLYPAEFIAVFFYNLATRTIVHVELNQALFQGEAAETARKLIGDGIADIAGSRPLTTNHVGQPFKLGTGTASKAPVDAKAAPAASTNAPPPAASTNAPATQAK